MKDFVAIGDQQVAAQVQEILCQAPPTWLDRAEQNFMSNLDFFKPIRVRAEPFWFWRLAQFSESELEQHTLQNQIGAVDNSGPEPGQITGFGFWFWFWKSRSLLSGETRTLRWF